MHGYKNFGGFTIVELLVVVTIIVVLLALLTPAMDKAIYEADLAVCSAHQKTIAMSTTNYALQYKRYYPYQAACDFQDSNWQAVSLYYHVAPWAPNTWDQRPLLRPFMDINKLFNDRLVTPVVLDNTLDDGTPNSSDATVDVVATMGLWAGYKYWNWEGMTKIGDKLEYRYGASVQYYDVMVSDRDVPGNPIGQPKLENDAWAGPGKGP
jgi:type II secretory pathway pseudopilin PulG